MAAVSDLMRYARENATSVLQAHDAGQNAPVSSAALANVVTALLDALDTREFQAVLECRNDPCPNCRAPKRRWVQAHPNGPFPTEDAARQHGRGMAWNVFGSEHRVDVQARLTGPWEEIR